MSAFSFYPTKNLGALGDAGAVITSDPFLADQVRLLANHGQLQKNNHVIEGANSRMDEVQAAFLKVNLKYFEEWNSRRISIAGLYKTMLKNADVILPGSEVGNTHVYHQFVVRVKNRRKVQDYLNQKGIQTLIHYPTPLPFTQAYSHLNCKKEDFPVSAKLSEEILSLPIYPGLQEEQVEYVCKSLIQVTG
jgi:dTDP-4-amino-4,6-dideoxygalactose transaminase